KAQLEFELEQPPTTPLPAELTAISQHIREVIGSGTHTAKKALFEALIDEIKIHSDGRLIPSFRIPLNGISPADEAEQTSDGQKPNGSAVRALPTMVGDTGFEPVTSSVSRKRAPTAPIARGGCGNRTRVQGFAGPCLSHSANPPETLVGAGS